MAVDARPTVAAPDDDPYLWLEEIDGERALAWVEGQNAKTLAKFGHAAFAADRDRSVQPMLRRAEAARGHGRSPLRPVCVAPPARG